MADQFAEHLVGRAERRSQESREDVIRRMVQEFDEMAGLTLTIPQACRLFFMSDDDRCTRIIREVVGRGLLKLIAEGVLVRPDNMKY